MSDVSSVSGVTGSDPSAAAGTTQSVSGSSGSDSGELTGSTQLQNMGQLKAKSAKLYNMMMQGIAMNIVNEMKAHQEKLKEMMRKAEQDAQGK